MCKTVNEVRVTLKTLGIRRLDGEESSVYLLFLLDKGILGVRHAHCWGKKLSIV